MVSRKDAKSQKTGTDEDALKTKTVPGLLDWLCFANSADYNTYNPTL